MPDTLTTKQKIKNQLESLYKLKAKAEQLNSGFQVMQAEALIDEALSAYAELDTDSLA